MAAPPYLAEGEVAIIEPLGASGFRIVAKITRDGWDALDNVAPRSAEADRKERGPRALVGQA